MAETNSASRGGGLRSWSRPLLSHAKSQNLQLQEVSPQTPGNWAKNLQLPGCDVHRKFQKRCVAQFLLQLSRHKSYAHGQTNTSFLLVSLSTCCTCIKEKSLSRCQLRRTKIKQLTDFLANDNSCKVERVWAYSEWKNHVILQLFRRGILVVSWRFVSRKSL